MTLRVVVDTNIVLFQLTPDPRAVSRLWHWFTEGMVRPVLSQYLVDEVRGKLALPKFSLTPATQAAIIADYLSFAEFVTDVPASGIENRDPKDTAILDLALAADVDALLSGDGDLLDLNGEFKFPIVRTSGLQQMLQLRTDTPE